VKRLLLSIAIGFGIVTIYTTAAAVAFLLSGENRALVPYLDLPMRLPKAIFFYLFPPTAQDFTGVMDQRRMLLTVLAYIANGLLYSIPSYGLFRLISRYRRTPRRSQLEPPLPPSFAD